MLRTALLCCLTVGCLGSPARSAPGGAAPPRGAAPALVKADAALPRPRPLPTIAPITWSAFPNDLTGPYGKSGRTLQVRPGRPGVIAAALERARRGDTILLEGGTYREGGDDYRALVINVEGIVLRTLPGQRARIVPRSAEVKRGMEILASHALVHGLDLVGFKDAGIGLGRDDHTIRGIIISDTTVEFKKDSEWHDGIVAYPDNRSLNKPSVDGLLLRNVTVRGASLGISCNAGPCKSWWLENVKVLNASGSGSGADAIGVENGDNMVLVNTEVSGATADGIDLKATRVLILGCRVRHIARNGIKLWRGGDVVNTIVHHTGADAAFNFKEPGKYRVLHTLMAFHNYRQGKSYNLTAGYDTKGRLEVELLNSIFYNTSGGMFFSDNTALKVQNCIFHNMENGNVMRAPSKGGKEREISLPQGPKVLERAGLGSGNLFANPNFVAPERGDFSLRPGSPARDRGKATGAYPAVDHGGAPRVAGRAPDIGPFEQ